MKSMQAKHQRDLARHQQEFELERQAMLADNVVVHQRVVRQEHVLARELEGSTQAFREEQARANHVATLQAHRISELRTAEAVTTKSVAQLREEFEAHNKETILRHEPERSVARWRDDERPTRS